MRILIAGLCLFATAPTFGQQLPWIPFHWEGGTLAGRHFDEVGITVPVTLDNLPHKFMMQLDLGATTIMVYGSPIAPYLAQYLAFKARYDTTRTFRIQGQKNGKLVGVRLKLGAVDFGARNLGYFKNFGDKRTVSTLANKAEVYVGTIRWYNCARPFSEPGFNHQLPPPAVVRDR